MFINLASGDIIWLKGGHGMSDLKILKIHFDHISLYNEKGLTIDFAAADRVSDFSEVFELKKPIYTQKLIALAGINATGKTIALKLIDLAMAVVLNHSSLNEADLLGTSYLEDQSRMTVDFYRNGMIYELESIFQRDDTERLTYREEFIRRKPIQSVKTKKIRTLLTKLKYGSKDQIFRKKYRPFFRMMTALPLWRLEIMASACGSPFRLRI